MRKTILNILFLAVCAGVLIFLLNAPDKTTSKLPNNDIHQKFHNMPKKVAEKQCMTCHYDGSDYALPKFHPPKFRCLFCHTKD